MRNSKGVIKKNTKKKLAEFKLAILYYQWTKNEKSPYLQVSGQPQTKNQNSLLNFFMVDIFEKSEPIFHEDGYAVSFFSATNYGVSCDSGFFITGMKNPEGFETIHFSYRH